MGFRGLLCLLAVGAFAATGCNCGGGTPTTLVFTVQPTDGVAGAPLAPGVQVTVVNAKGEPVRDAKGIEVTVALDANPSGGTLSGTTRATVANGVATFADLSVEKAGPGYTLKATAANLGDGVSSDAFVISPAAASRLAISRQPVDGSTDGALAPVGVLVQDAFANTVASTADVKVALAANPGGATLTGTTTVRAANGAASFTDLNLDKPGDGYTLAFSSDGLTAVTSAPFKLVIGNAKSLAVTAQPPASTTAGAPFAVTVEVRDARGNTANAFSGPVTVTLGNNAGNGTLSGTATVNAVKGVATFAGLSIDKAAAGYTLAFASGTLTGATSNAFAITAAAAAKLAFTAQPSDAVAGATIAPAVSVAILDIFGNQTSSTAGVSLGLVATNGATLLGGTTASAVGGVATFAGLSVQKAGTGYALSATSGTLTGASSSAFNVSPAAPAKLAFTAQPSNAVAGVALAPAVAVTVQDAFGNATSATPSVTVALVAANGATLSGTKTVSAASGVATFASLSVQKVGTGYTLAATSPGLSGASSGAFAITPAADAALAFSVQPSNAVAGAPITPAVKVTVLDAFGNVATGSSAGITVALQGATLFGTQTVSAVAGVATFADLSVHKVGSGYALSASSGGLTGATSNTFDVTHAAASQLAFTGQPSNAAAGVAIAPAVVVTVRDAFGNTVTSSTASVTVSLAGGSGLKKASPKSKLATGAALFGTKTVSAVAGVATFSNLSVQQADTGYTLSAASSGLTGATSNTFDVTPAAASQLVFTTQPSNTSADAAIAPAVTVTVKDAYGNTVTNSTASVTAALAFNPAGATLSGTTTVSAVNGVATFAGLFVRKAGTGYALTAASSGLTGGTSNTFDVSAGAAAQLAITTQPSNAVAGQAIAPAVAVTVQDAYGNTATSSTASVMVDLAPNPGGATLSGTKTVSAVAGVATFADLNVRKAGTGYVLNVASSGLPSLASAAFNISAAAANQLAFSVQPQSSVAGTALTPAVMVTVQDAYGNTATGSTASVTVALASNPGGDTLTGTATQSAVAGVATFANLTLRKVATGYTLSASSAGLTGDTSLGFNITPAAPSVLVFSRQPSDIQAGQPFSPTVAVQVQDAFANVVTASTASITLAISTNPGGATLTGTATQSAVAGEATFANVTLDKAATGYKLSATAAGLPPATSAAFNVSAGPAARLSILTQPSNANAGMPITPAVRVAVADAFGNQTASTAPVTVAIASGPAGGALSGTLTQSAVAGVATFIDLALSRRGAYTLSFSSSGLLSVTSSSFTVFQPGLSYTPATPAGKLALVKNAASTPDTVVLDLVTTQDVSGYSVGMNLPLDASKVSPNAALMIPGAALNPGTGAVAVGATLPSTGPLAGVLVSGQSQKAAGAGAVATDTLLPAGTVLYTLQLDINPAAGGGTVFDGANLLANPKFRALLRDKQGNDTVLSTEVDIGKLDITLQ